MGGGKGGGGGCQTVGYGYTLTMLYAFCERADKVSGWKVNDKIWWADDSLLIKNKTYSTYQQNLYTGKKGTVYHSDGSDHTNITFYLKDYGPISYPQNTIGYDIKLNNIVFAYMPDAFVGDNTTTVPRYEARLSRFVINGTNHKIGTGSINPIAVIQEILQDYLQITEIDTDSFNEAYNTCKEEGLGVSFIMTTEKKIKDWLKEILRVIDGVLWFDTLTGKWKIKLLRPKTDNNTIYEISENNASKIEITSGSWDSLINEFTFKYTNILTGKTESFTIQNTALFNILGYKVGKTYTYQLIGEYNIMAKVASKIIKKNSKPLSQIKARISILDLPYIELGDIIKVTSKKLNLQDKYFRVVKIGGDKEDDIYIDIEGVEEVWELDYNGTIISEPPATGGGQGYDIVDAKPYITTIYELPNIFVANLKSNNQPISSIVTYPAGYENQYMISGTNKTYSYSGQSLNVAKPFVAYFGKLDNNFLNSNQAVNRSQTLVIKPFDTTNYCEFPTITQTEEQWQQNRWVLLIENEFFSVKTVAPVDTNAHTYQINGIIRLMDRQHWKTYNSDTTVYLLNLSSLTDLVDFTVNRMNTTINLTAQLYNYATKSTANTTQKSLTGVARKLLNPTYNYVYEEKGNLYLVFSKMARGLNTHATFENIEYITAGENEGAGEETHIVIQYNNTTIDIPLLSNAVISNENGLIKIELSQVSSDITYSNIQKFKTQCLTDTYVLESDFVDVIKK